MRARTLLAAATAVATTAALTPANAAPSPARHRPDSTPGTRWIVRYRSSSVADQGIRAASDQVQRRFTHVFPGAVVTMDATQAARLRATAGVLSVEPDVQIHAAGVEVNPPASLDRVDQRTSRQTRSFSNTYTGAGVLVYVVDSGINASNVDFTGRVAAGRSYIPGTTTDDDYGHGTHVAGIAAGTRMGVAKKATLVPVKVLDDMGDGDLADAVSALDWIMQQHATDHRPSVVNLSVDGPASPALDAAVDRLVAAGVPVVAAAGNGGTDACRRSPARDPHAIAVANADTRGWAAASSNRGPCVDLYAPGQWVLSDGIGSPTATAVMSGTSMSAPLVAGEAALVLQARPFWSPAQVTAEILGKATRGAILGNPAGTPNLMLYTSGGVTPAMLERVGSPSVTGTARVGSTLVGRAGTWGNAPVHLAYAWVRIDRYGHQHVVAGRAGTTYRLTSADRGFRLAFRVTGSKTDYASRSVTSAPSATVR